MTTLIKIDALSKTFRDKRLRKIEAVKQVTFSIDEGEAFGFVGPNGAGKSTTIKILAGLIRPSSGRAEVLGFPIDDPRARKGLGYVPENAYLYDYLTPLEVLLMGVRLHGLRKPDLKRHCMNWLERFGVAHVANRRIRSFSKGMAQRTALAHALCVEPRLLILDEPLSGLDPIGRKEVVDELLAYRHGGGTVLFSSHVLHDVERLADRFGLIHQGSLRTVQRPEELVGGQGSAIIRSMGQAPVEGMQADVGGRWFAQVSSDQQWPLLNRIQSAGHTLIEIKPSMSLEQAFLRYVAVDEAASAASSANNKE
ncbi:ABC transporter ATP-binding protein [Chitinimonas naiadis]